MSIDNGKKKTIKSEMVAARLRDYIIENGLKSGDKLPTEGELTEIYGVSRVSVREATKALSFLGIVDAAPRRGLTVGTISMERISRYLGFHLAVSQYPMEELIDTRIILETGGLPQLSKRMKADPAIYQQLNAINGKLRKAKRMSNRVENDIAFHRLLVESTGLSALAAFNDLIQVFFLKFRKNFRKTDWTEVVRDHQQTIDSLRDGKPKLAAEHLSAHIGINRELAAMDN